MTNLVGPVPPRPSGLRLVQWWWITLSAHFPWTSKCGKSEVCVVMTTGPNCPFPAAFGAYGTLTCAMRDAMWCELDVEPVSGGCCISTRRLPIFVSLNLLLPCLQLKVLEKHHSQYQRHPHKQIFYCSKWLNLRVNIQVYKTLHQGQQPLTRHYVRVNVHLQNITSGSASINKTLCQGQCPPAKRYIRVSIHQQNIMSGSTSTCKTLCQGQHPPAKHYVRVNVQLQNMSGSTSTNKTLCLGQHPPAKHVRVNVHLQHIMSRSATTYKTLSQGHHPPTKCYIILWRESKKKKRVI